MKTIATIALIALAAPAVAADEATLEDRITGAWRLVSLETARTDGTRTDPFGEDPEGIMILTEDGRFARIIMRAGLPLYARADWMKGTEEEYRAIARGSNATFGTFHTNEWRGEVVFDVHRSSFPNWDGARQARLSSVEGDVWRQVGPAGPAGDGHLVAVWERL